MRFYLCKQIKFLLLYFYAPLYEHFFSHFEDIQYPRKSVIGAEVYKRNISLFVDILYIGVLTVLIFIAVHL